MNLGCTRFGLVLRGGVSVAMGKFIGRFYDDDPVRTAAEWILLFSGHELWRLSIGSKRLGP